ncbi:hypothetical protein ABZY09_22170 [Streptomyces sp. NPDC002928]|uniref:effector-associated constant component EACC1 n=1 Tax=Streptomyces sp. NPDC002928 TaxID=3154440 RepID=UPI0033A6A30E
MSETVRIEIRGGVPSDLLRSIHAALTHEPQWRGRVSFVEAPQQPEGLGGLIEALAVALAPGGAAAVLVGAVVSWVRRQSVGDVVCRLSRPDGTSVEVSAPLARSLRGADEVRALVEDLTRQLEHGSRTSDGE